MNGNTFFIHQKLVNGKSIVMEPTADITEETIDRMRAEIIYVTTHNPNLEILSVDLITKKTKIFVDQIKIKNFAIELEVIARISTVKIFFLKELSNPVLKIDKRDSGYWMLFKALQTTDRVAMRHSFASVAAFA